MKILILATDFFSKGGIQRYTRYQYQALVDIYGKENIFVFSLAPKKEDNFFENDVMVEYIGEGDNLSNKINFLFEVLRFIRKYKINIIIINHVQLSIIGYIAKKLFAIEYVINVYGLEIWSGLKYKDKIGLLNSNRIIGDCNFILKYIKNNFNYNTNKLSLLYDPVDVNRFIAKDKNIKLMKKYNIPQNKFIISTIGRLERNKGHNVIIESLTKLNNNVIYVIVGDGFMKSELDNLINNLNLKNRVIFTGRVHENELIDFYNIADVVALLSTFEKDEGEGLPLGLIEASACETPILTGKEDGSYEAISDKYPNGFRISPRNIGEIVEKIQFYIDNPDIKKQHGKNGRRFVIEEFKYSKFRNKQANIIEKILKK